MDTTRLRTSRSPPTERPPSSSVSPLEDGRLGTVLFFRPLQGRSLSCLLRAKIHTLSRRFSSVRAASSHPRAPSLSGAPPCSVRSRQQNSDAPCSARFEHQSNVIVRELVPHCATSASTIWPVHTILSQEHCRVCTHNSRDHAIKNGK